MRSLSVDAAHHVRRSARLQRAGSRSRTGPPRPSASVAGRGVTVWPVSAAAAPRVAAATVAPRIAATAVATGEAAAAVATGIAAAAVATGIAAAAVATGIAAAAVATGE